MLSKLFKREKDPSERQELEAVKVRVVKVEARVAKLEKALSILRRGR